MLETVVSPLSLGDGPGEGVWLVLEKMTQSHSTRSLSQAG